MQLYRQALTAAANNYAPAQTALYGGYGASPSGAEYNGYAPNSHVTTGGSYQPNSGSGYAAGPAYPAHPPVNEAHPYPPAQPAPVYNAPTYPVNKPSSTKSKKKKGDSTVSALTLLAFFFFVNLLQSCLKEHMSTMNPTVMVMTVNGVRNRFNKLAEMNSREQNAAVASDSSNSNIAVLQPEELKSAASSSHAVVGVIVGQSPYSSDLVHAHKAVATEMPQYNYNNKKKKSFNDDYYPENNNKNIATTNANKQDNNKYNPADEYTHSHTNSFSNQSLRPEFYDSIHSYSKSNYSTAPHVFSTYFRTSTADADADANASTNIRTTANKSHNYSYQNELKQQESYPAFSAFDKTYHSSLGVTAAPTTYWSLAAVSSSSSDSDIYQHHTHDDDDIDHRYAFDSYYAQRN